MHKIDSAGVYTKPTDAETHFQVQLDTEAMTLGTYSIPAGGVDDQRPHREDEVYVVTAGRAKLVTDSGTTDVAPGDTIFVPAHERHTFTEITEDLALLVFFAPAYSGPGD